MRTSVGTRVLQIASGLLLLGAASGCAHHGCHKPAHGGHPGLGGIVVSGTGEAHGAPDLARTSIGVEVRAPSVQEATQQANAQMNNLLRALKEQGIAEADLRTHGYSVTFDRDYRIPQPLPEVAPAAAPAKAPKRSAAAEGAPAAAVASAPVPPPEAGPRGSYVVSNTVEVTIRNVDKLGDVLSAATAAGANNIWGINFDVADKRPLVERARAEAFQNAKADAQRLADLSGVKLGKLTLVNDGAGGPAVGPVFGVARMAAAEAVPVQRGELTVSHQVELHFEIARGDEHEKHGEHHEGHQHGEHAEAAPPPPPAPAADAPKS